MCAQYNQTSSTHEISKRFNAKDFNSPPEFKQHMFPKYNGVVVYPEKGSPILKVMEWGLLPESAKDRAVSKKYATFNARSESVETSRLFAPPFENGQRCIIPVNSFIEWADRAEGKRKITITRPDEPLFGIAGLWNLSSQFDGGPLWTFTMLTTEPAPAIEPIHSRMPLTIHEKNYEPWLAGESDLEELCQEAKNLEFHVI